MMPALAAIPPPPGNAFELGPLTVHYYGIAIALGVLAAILVARHRYATFGGDAELIDKIALWAVLAGLIGARLAWVSTNLDRVLADPVTVIAIWQGGLAFFGGLVFGAAAAIWVLRRNRGDLPALADAVAPALPLAQAIGRWGNYFNEELYGTPTDLPWALQLSTGELVHPAFLYESLWNLALAAVLWWLGSQGLVRRGGLMFCYAIGYGIVRFGLEQIRIDANWEPLGMAINAWAALVAVIGGTAALVWWQRGQPSRDAAGAPPGRARDR